MKRLAALAMALILISCAHDQETIREGMLTLNLRQSAFLDEWGKPDRTYVTSGQEIMQAGWNQQGGGFFKGRETFEVWVYTARKTELLFNRKKRLAGWKTDATVQELSSPKRN